MTLVMTRRMTNGNLEDMTAKTFRLDSASAAALAYLEEQMAGSSFSEIMRTSLLECADSRRRAALREEAYRVANDPNDRAEAKSILAEMEELSAW